MKSVLVIILFFLTFNEVSPQIYLPDRSTVNPVKGGIPKYYFNDLDLFFNAGFAPIKVGGGLGYQFREKIEIYISYQILTLPMVVNHRTISLGLKAFTTKKQLFFYLIEFGWLFDATHYKNPAKHIGWVIEGGIGQILYKKSNFYINGKLRLDLYIRRNNKPAYMPGIDFSLGWYMNL